MCSAPHLSWTDQPLAEGDLFYIELGGIRHRYHSPLSRCIYLGQPPDELKRLAEVIAEGLQAVLDAVKAGVTCADLAAAWRRVSRKHGIEKDSRIGYPGRHRLSAHMGRVDGELACGGHDGAGAQHDLPLHSRDLARE